MSSTAVPPLKTFLAPRYWPTWIGLGFLVLCCWLPWFLRMGIGALLGHLMYFLGRDRRYITRINLRLCFPELDDGARQRLLRLTFVANGMGIMETTSGWVRSANYFRNKVKIRNFELMQAALDQGRGVLVLGAHYTSLDLGANLISTYSPIAVTYRPHNNPLFDTFIMKGRMRHCAGVFDRHNLRSAWRHMKKGGILWFAPDQDYGPEHAVYAPFFGHRAATVTTASRLAALNKSPVLVTRQHRLPGRNAYEIEFFPLPEPFPSGDELADATRMNLVLEKAIRHYPEQYLWMHKRFKTQPGGQPESPYIDINPAVKSLNLSRYEKLTEGAERLSASEMKLNSGFMLRLYRGLPGRIMKRRHPAWHLDRMARDLRLSGLPSLTVNKIFLLPDSKQTAVHYYAVPGITLQAMLDNQDELPLTILGQWLARLHLAGFHMQLIDFNQLHFHEQQIWMTAPESLSRGPSSLCFDDRKHSLARFLKALSTATGKPPQTFAALYEAYREHNPDMVLPAQLSHFTMKGLKPTP